MLKNLAGLLTFTACLSCLHAQDRVQEAWVRHYGSGLVSGHDFATAIAVDNSGNVYVTGRSPNAPNGFDYLTVKYNATGNQLWTSRYDGTGHADDMPVAIAVDVSGNVYVTGTSAGLDTEIDCATIKYNSAGVEQWAARHNGPGNLDDVATALGIDTQGNVYVGGWSFVAGTDDGYGNPTDDYLLIKYDSAGVEQWVAAYNGPANSGDGISALVVDAAGSVYVTGSSVGTITGVIKNVDFVTIKYDPAGIRQWIAQLDRFRFDRPIGLDIDHLGNVYVAGSSQGSLYPNYVTMKYNSEGVEQWVAYKEAIDFGITKAMSIDAAGNVYVTGMNSFHYFTLKYDTGGVEQWAVSSSDGANEVSDLVVDASGNIYVTGNSLQDYATIKYNPAGIEQWVARYDLPENGTDTPSAMAVDAAGNIYVTGTSRRLIGMSSYDYATVKYNSAGEQQWAARHESRDSRDRAAAMALDGNGNVVVTGISEVGSFNSYSFASVKYSSDGALQWVAHEVNGSLVQAIAVDKTGNIYVTGWIAGDHLTIKYNAAGVKQWAARYNGPKNLVDVAIDIVVDDVGNVYVTGGSDAPTSGDFEYYATIKYNSAGVEQWVARHRSLGILPDRVPHLAVDLVGNVYVSGKATIKYDSLGVEQWVANYSDGFANAIAVDAAGNVYITGDRLNDYFTIKYNLAGAEEWIAGYNGPGNNVDVATDIVVDFAGNAYVTGKSWSMTGDDYTTIKYSSAGVEQWVARYNGPESRADAATALAIDLLGNVYVTGMSDGVSRIGARVYNRDFATVKYNSAGEEQWVARYSGPGYSYDEVKAIAVDARGNVFVAGWSLGAYEPGSWSVYTTIKYVQNPVGVAEPDVRKPQHFKLLQNYPNPFNPSTKFRYTVARPGRVALQVFNLQGQEVATLVNENKAAGEYEMQWQPVGLPSGVYFYRLRALEYVETRKLVLMR